MRCEHARAALSAAADGAPVEEEAAAAATAAHVAACSGCRAFAADIDGLRRRLRFEAVGPVPDVVPGVLATLRDGEARRGLWWQRAHRALRFPARPRLAPRLGGVAVFCVAALVGALVAGAGPQPDRALAADLPARIAAAQTRLQALSADLTVTEHGWHPLVAVRRYEGRLAYEAPERLTVALRDLTTYPSAAWTPNDVTVVVAEDRAWTSGPRPCPATLQPDCTAQVDLRAVVGREPFDQGSPAPLDLVLPVRSFLGAADPPTAGRRTVAARDAIGVHASAAQAGPLLDGLRTAGNWRALHATDEVTLWLDEAALVPLAVRVVASDDPDRARWAVRHGYGEEPAGTPLLSIELADVRLDTTAAEAAPPAPDGATVVDSGFDDAAEPSAAPVPGRLPTGMRPHRDGVSRSAQGPAVAVRSWTDGQAWLVVRATRDWSGDRLFGGRGALVRRVDLGPAGTAYVAEGGTTIALHAADLDVTVSGSLDTAALLDVAGSLGVVGQTAPDGWPESSSATVGDAKGVLPALLVPAADDAFAPVAVNVADDVVTLSAHGPGERAFVLVQAPGARLSPPLGDDVSGVRVRGTDGRWSAERGELEWIEDAGPAAGAAIPVAVTLRSETLSLAEILAVAERLRR